MLIKTVKYMIFTVLFFTPAAFSAGSNSAIALKISDAKKGDILVLQGNDVQIYEEFCDFDKHIDMNSSSVKCVYIGYVRKER